MESQQPLGNLLDDCAHGLEIGLRIVDHPLPQGLAVDELRDDIEVVALARQRPRPKHVRAVDAAGDPLLHHERFQVGLIGTQVDRGNLQRDRLAAFDIDGKIEMAAAAGMELPHDPVAVEDQARFEQGWQRQVGCQPQLLGRLAIGKLVDLDDLDREIVRTAVPQRLRNDRLRRTVQVIDIVVDGAHDDAAIDVLANAVGGLHEDVALFQRQHAIVDLDPRAHAQRATEIDLLRRQRHAMVVGQLLQRAAGQAIQAGIADVEDVCGGRLQDQDVQRADVALVLVVGKLALPGLCMQP